MGKSALGYFPSRLLSRLYVTVLKIDFCRIISGKIMVQGL